MPKAALFVLANSHSVDQQTNRLSIFEVIEELRSATFPTVLPQADAITLWQCQANERGKFFEHRVRVVRPDNVEVNTVVNKFKMVSERQRIINRAYQIPFEIPGVYTLELYIRPDGEEDWGFPMRILPLPVLEVKHLKLVRGVPPKPPDPPRPSAPPEPSE